MTNIAITSSAGLVDSEINYMKNQLKSLLGKEQPITVGFFQYGKVIKITARINDDIFSGEHKLARKAVKQIINNIKNKR